MKLSEWAKLKGIHYRTAIGWVKNGKMPVPFERLPSGTIIVHVTTEVEIVNHPVKAALYARVSTVREKPELEAQMGRLAAFAVGKGLDVIQTAAEVGPGLNGNRPKLMKLLSDPAVKVIVIEHRDRLLKFGAEYVEAALSAQGRSLLVMKHGEDREDDFHRDMEESLVAICSRLYGGRVARRMAMKAMKTIQEFGQAVQPE